MSEDEVYVTPACPFSLADERAQLGYGRTQGSHSLLMWLRQLMPPQVDQCLQLDERGELEM